MLFAGGPAPAANAVISACAASFVRNGIGVLGIKYGYSRLVEYAPAHLSWTAPRLTENHLYYGLAWWGGGELLARARADVVAARATLRKANRRIAKLEGE